MKTLLTLHYRPPFKNGRSNSFGQYYFHEVFNENFEVRGLSFGEQGENLNNFHIIHLENSSFKKIKNFILKLESVRLTHFNSLKFRKILFEQLAQFDPDFIYVEHIVMMQYLVHVKTKAKVILFDDDSFLYSKAHGLEGSLYQKVRNYRLAKFEKKALNRANYIITITEQEKSFLESSGYGNIFWVPYGIDTDYFSFNWKQPKENSILFVGNFDHYPNREAIKFLSREILPELLKLNGKLRIVGRNIYRINKYLSEEIEVFEDVPDVRNYYWNSTVFVAPIFSGAGLRIKILEAAACGIPIITTMLGNLGCNISDEGIFIANSKNKFIQSIKELFDSETELINKKTIYVRKMIENNFSIKSVQESIQKFISPFLL